MHILTILMLRHHLIVAGRVEHGAATTTVIVRNTPCNEH